MTDLGLTVVQLYPNLLGTYGDAGNAIVLRARALARGLACQVVVVHPGEAVPASGDIYLLGGGEDAKQTAAAQALREDGALVAAAGRGAVVIGICAGYQLLGRTFLGVGGALTAGLELLDVSTGRLDRRAVGNLLATASAGLGLPPLIGFENHGGATVLGPDAAPLGVVEIGVGNGDLPAGGRRTEGAVQGNVYGSYLHGPALALNPALADRLLSAVAGPLAPIDDTLADRLREHRLVQVLPAAVRASRRRSLADRLRGSRSGSSGAVATLSAQSAGDGR